MPGTEISIIQISGGAKFLPGKKFSFVPKWMDFLRLSVNLKKSLCATRAGANPTYLLLVFKTTPFYRVARKLDNTPVLPLTKGDFDCYIPDFRVHNIVTEMLG